MYKKPYIKIAIFSLGKAILFVILKIEKIFLYGLKKSNDKPIIIIGMHRSGTSLLSELIEQERVFLGKNKDENNEPYFFLSLNKKILNLSVSTWDYLPNLDYGNAFLSKNIIKFIESKLNSFSAIKYWGWKNFFFKSKIANWGWKDPRNTLNLEYWMEMFPNARIIHIVRNPIDVAISLKKRQEDLNEKDKWDSIKMFYAKYFTKRLYFGGSFNCVDINNGIALWEKYLSKVEKYEKNIFTIRYEDLLENPNKVLTEVFNYLDIKKNNKNYHLVDKNKAYKFKTSIEYTKKYNEIKSNNFLKKYNYNTII